MLRATVRSSMFLRRAGDAARAGCKRMLRVTGPCGRKEPPEELSPDDMKAMALEFNREISFIAGPLADFDDADDEAYAAPGPAAGAHAASREPGSGAAGGVGSAFAEAFAAGAPPAAPGGEAGAARAQEPARGRSREERLLQLREDFERGLLPASVYAAVLRQIYGI